METNNLISGILSFGRSFTFHSLDSLAAHFSGSQDGPYQEGFRHILEYTLALIHSQYSSSNDIAAGQYAEIRDAHIETVLGEVKSGEHSRYIPYDKVEDFNKYFRPIVMAYVKFRYQPGREQDRKPVDVQGALFDTSSFYVGYGTQRENTDGPDIELFEKGADNRRIMTLQFSAKNLSPAIETVTIERTEYMALMPTVPLSVIHSEPSTSAYSTITLARAGVLPTATVPLFNSEQPLINHPHQMFYPQQLAYGQCQEGFSAPQHVYYPTGEQTQIGYSMQSHPGHRYPQEYLTNFVQYQPPAYAPQNPQQVYSQVAPEYQPNLQQPQGWNIQTSTYPNTNPFVTSSMLPQPAQVYPHTNPFAPQQTLQPSNDTNPTAGMHWSRL